MCEDVEDMEFFYIRHRPPPSIFAYDTAFLSTPLTGVFLRLQLRRTSRRGCGELRHEPQEFDGTVLWKALPYRARFRARVRGCGELLTHLVQGSEHLVRRTYPGSEGMVPIFLGDQFVDAMNHRQIHIYVRTSSNPMRRICRRFSLVGWRWKDLGGLTGYCG